jgi:phospholipid-transporting ATPase
MLPNVHSELQDPFLLCRDIPSQKPIRKFPILKHNPLTKDIFAPNSIRTSKYTAWSFFPINLLEQITKLSNLYFITFSILQVIPAVSNTNGRPIILVPLTIVIFVSMIKDFVEDYKRWKSDTSENNSGAASIQDGQEIPVKWKDIRVGQLIKVSQNEIFPADLLLLRTSDDLNICYVEMKSLDGETNLKHKSIPSHCLELLRNIGNFENISSTIECEEPKPNLYEFKGALINENSRVPIQIDQLLLRGSILRNTSFIIGAVVYTGHDSKIMKNGGVAPTKTSKMSQEIYTEILYIFCIEILLSFVYAICNVSWYDIHINLTYLQIKSSNYAKLSMQSIGIWLLTLA